MSELVRGDPQRHGLQDALLDQRVRVGDRGVDDVLADVVSRAGLAAPR
jgi:hypothetical protein